MVKVEYAGPAGAIVKGTWRICKNCLKCCKFQNNHVGQKVTRRGAGNVLQISNKLLYLYFTKRMYHV